MTNIFRMHRHIAMDPCCSRCNKGLHETTLHAVRDCSIIAGFWFKLVDAVVHADFYTLDMHQWLL